MTRGKEERKKEVVPRREKEEEKESAPVSQPRGALAAADSPSSFLVKTAIRVCRNDDKGV